MIRASLHVGSSQSGQPHDAGLKPHANINFNLEIGRRYIHLPPTAFRAAGVDQPQPEPSSRRFVTLPPRRGVSGGGNAPDKDWQTIRVCSSVRVIETPAG